MNDNVFKILLVEADEDEFTLIGNLLSEVRMDIELFWVSNYYDAVEAFERGEQDLCLVDFKLGEESALELLKQAAELNYRAPIILFTDQSDIGLEVEAMRMGAADCLIKAELTPQLIQRSIRYAIERAKLIEALRELAIRDELTGLYNRHEIARILSGEVARSLRYRCDLSLLIIHVENISRATNMYGHRVEEAVLQSVAQVLRDGIRATDRPARFSDQQFIVVLTETSGHEAYYVAERLRETIASRKITVAGSDRRPVELGVTLSLGLASLPTDMDSEDGLIEAASRALYEARRQGRNRTVQYKELPAEKEIEHPALKSYEL